MVAGLDHLFNYEDVGTLVGFSAIPMVFYMAATTPDIRN